jgi:hypothetical protein
VTGPTSDNENSSAGLALPQGVRCGTGWDFGLVETMLAHAALFAPIAIERTFPFALNRRAGNGARVRADVKRRSGRRCPRYRDSNLIGACLGRSESQQTYAASHNECCPANERWRYGSV